MERGILGIKKDPRNAVLFSFKTRQGDEWPSSDSQDSDYNPYIPQNEDVTVIKTTKKRKKKGKKKINKSDSESDCEEESEYVERKNKKVKKSHSKKNRHNDHVTPCNEFQCFDVTGTNAGVKLVIKKSPEQAVGNGERKSVNVYDACNVGPELWGSRIPPEILLQILQHVVKMKGTLPFLCRAAKVCRLWREVAAHPSLWHNVDLSYGWIRVKEVTLTWLCHHRLSQVHDLNLSSWKALTAAGLECIAENCPQLQAINLSNCSKINAASVKSLVDKCPMLGNFDLSSTPNDILTAASLKYLVDSCSANMTHFNVSGNTLKGFNSVLNDIMEKCHRLELLDLSNVVFSSDFLTLNIEKLQHGCPRLMVLCFTNTKIRATYAPGKVRAEALGFPKLEQLSLAVNRDGVGIGFSDDFLDRLVKNATNLKLLDLRGSTHITASGVHSLPSLDMRQLYLSNSSISKHTGIELIMQKWARGLTEVDLSWNIFPEGCIDLAMEQLAADPASSSLQLLNLSGTSVSCQGVRTILHGCPKLKQLNLGSCRGLARGMKCEHSGKRLRQLRNNIDAIIKGEEMS